MNLKEYLIIDLKEDSNFLESYNNKITYKKIFDPINIKFIDPDILSLYTPGNINKFYNELINNLKDINYLLDMDLIFKSINESREQYFYLINKYNPIDHKPWDYKINVFINTILDLLFEIINSYGVNDSFIDLMDLLSYIIDNSPLNKIKFKLHLNNNYINVQLTGGVYNGSIIHNIIYNNLEEDLYCLKEDLNLNSLEQINLLIDPACNISLDILKSECLLIEAVNNTCYPGADIKYLNYNDPFILFSFMDMINLINHMELKNNIIIDPYKIFELIDLYCSREHESIFMDMAEEVYDQYYNNEYNNFYYEYYPAGSYLNNSIKLYSIYEVMDLIKNNFKHINPELDIKINYLDIS